MVTDGMRIRDLGPFGIVREAFAIFRGQAKVFLLIQIALVLPGTLIGLASNYLLTGDSQVIFTPSKMRPQSSAAATVSFDGSSSTKGPLEIIGLSAASVLLNLAIESVWMSATLYAVGMIYTDTNISFVDVIHVIPRLWKRVMVTNLYGLLVACASLFLMIVLMVPVSMGRVSAAWTLLLCLPIFVIFVAVLFWSVITQLAEASSVLDENYGWAAIGKVFKLLQGRIWVVLGVLCIGIIVMAPFMLVLSQILKAPLTLEKLVAGVIVLVVNSFVKQFYVLCDGVTYVSLKAYHGEDIADSIFSRGLTKRPYKAVENNYQHDLAKEDSPV